VHKGIYGDEGCVRCHADTAAEPAEPEYVRHEVYEVQGYLLANNWHLDHWMGRSDFVGFEYEKSKKRWASPIMWRDHGGLCSAQNPEGTRTPVRPIAVWQRKDDA
jgi:hypothetical protein